MNIKGVMKMRMKRIACTFLCCVLLIGSVLTPVNAAGTEETITPFATGTFNMTILPYSKADANGSFPLDAGETVTIRAYYTPTSASVDFGVVSSEGTFYYFNTTDGNMNKTMRITVSGYYTLRIRNNSNSPVQVSGFVNY